MEPADLKDDSVVSPPGACSYHEMDIVEHLPSYERHMSSFQVELDSKLKERKSRALASDLIIDQSEGQDERYDEFQLDGRRTRAQGFSADRHIDTFQSGGKTASTGDFGDSVLTDHTDVTSSPRSGTMTNQRSQNRFVRRNRDINKMSVNESSLGESKSSRISLPFHGDMAPNYLQSSSSSNDSPSRTGNLLQRLKSTSASHIDDSPTKKPVIATDTQWRPPVFRTLSSTAQPDASADFSSKSLGNAFLDKKTDLKLLSSNGKQVSFSPLDVGDTSIYTDDDSRLERPTPSTRFLKGYGTIGVKQSNADSSQSGSTVSVPDMPRHLRHDIERPMSTERDSSAANQLCQKYGKLQSNSEGFTFDEARQAAGNYLYSDKNKLPDKLGGSPSFLTDVGIESGSGVIISKHGPSGTIDEGTPTVKPRLKASGGSSGIELRGKYSDSFVLGSASDCRVGCNSVHESSICEEVIDDPRVLLENVDIVGRASSQSNVQLTERQLADDVIDKVKDEQDRGDIKRNKTLRPLSCQAKVQHRPKPRHGALPGDVTVRTAGAVEFNSTADIRDAVYEDWYRKHIKAMRMSEKRRRQQNEERIKRQKKADEERRSDALLSFQAWEREKKKSMTMHKNRRCQIERGKHRTEEQERKEKMVESEVSFNAWKRTKDERLSSRLEEIRIAENNKKDVLARAKRQKNRDGASAFSKWKTDKDISLKETMKEKKDREEKLEITLMASHKQREEQAQLLYEEWMFKKEKNELRKKIAAGKCNFSPEMDFRPPFRPANHIIPFGR